MKNIKALMLSTYTLLILLGCMLTAPIALAACPSGEALSTSSNQCEPVKRAVDCPSGKVDASDPTKCAPLGNGCNGNTADTCLNKNPITKNLNNFINFLSAGVGIVVIGAIILGGIQYTLAGDNATATQAAKQRITNGLIALLAFMFLYAFLQWIIPGGL